MPPNDQEPRYRLVDANGNVVGSLFLNGNGDVAIQDESGTETAFTANGISTPAVDTNSVSTVEAIIDGHGSVNGVESDTVTQSGPDASGDDATWETVTTTTTSHSFDTEFDAEPKVVIVAQADGGSLRAREQQNVISSVTTTGFEWEISQYRPVDRSSETYAIDYIAIEQS